MYKKIGFEISIVLLMIVACSNSYKTKNDDSVELNWKLSTSDTLTYSTVMHDIEESNFEMHFGNIYNEILDSASTKINKDFYKKIDDLYNNVDFETSLSNSPNFKDVIDIEMIAVPKDKSKNEKGEFGQMMNEMMKGPMLRGSINKDGSIHSFWVKGNQKNLISMFFELPNRPIKEGDTWSLNNINYIQFDQNFICNKNEKKNTITLSEIKEIDNEKIAVIDYDIMEYIVGDYKVPSFMTDDEVSESKETMMKFVYTAQGEFSIDKGKWIKYNAIAFTEGTGVMEASIKQKFALIEK